LATNLFFGEFNGGHEVLHLQVIDEAMPGVESPGWPRQAAAFSTSLLRIEVHFSASRTIAARTRVKSEFFGRQIPAAAKQLSGSK